MFARYLVLLTVFPVLAVLAAEPKATPKSSLANVRIELEKRTGQAESERHGLGHTAGGTILVDTPRADTVQVLLSGLVAAGGLPLESSHAVLKFDVTQRLRVVADRPSLTRVSLESTLIGQFIGTRDGAGVASVDLAECTLLAGDQVLLANAFPPRSHASATTLFVNDRYDPSEVVLPSGSVVCLNMRFLLRSEHPKRLCHKNVLTAAFGPEAPKVPDWLNLLAPGRDLPRQPNLGLRAMVRVAPAQQ
jgi:hypothetical protein